jgi:uncharacterized SAM-binding protein YcdF (DUF218 family)
MQCFRRCLLVFLALLALGLGACAGVALLLAPWLSEDDVPVRSSAIAVLGGDPSRSLEAADLYHRGYAPRIFLSVSERDPRQHRLDSVGVIAPRDEDLMRLALVARGVPEGAISLLARNLENTAAEARALAAKLGSGETLLVVTSPFHVRRARMVIRTVLPGERFRVIGSRYETLPVAWWRERESARNVVVEIAKLVFFLAGGSFPT